ncbi:hypothetical protein N7474_004409 [Penicillium riverlandense]|uniref:uncharacterized protein n=1 Tax=Penicillium riverlandense TaxID=1903569 RepID=UPI00254774FE|nr:uncharacterized protein N7474_004409 [Penicillium riverlandense]KAJ5818818.1 hypothetical protein N7474_004409 [Penicillium riverlandense]
MDLLQEFASASGHAKSHHPGDSSLFDSAMGFLQENQDKFSGSGSDINEEHAMRAHKKMYNESAEGHTHNSSDVGAGAAVQALKMFTSGEGGGDKNQFVGMAMAQAGKLWDQKAESGGTMSGDKQSAINTAAEMALKMYMKGGGGMGGTGGPGGLMSLASKFM